MIIFIEWVKQFPYVGSLITDDGRVGAEIERRIESASKAFGALQHAVINNFHLSIETDQLVCMAVLLCGSKCWTPLFG